MELTRKLALPWLLLVMIGTISPAVGQQSSPRKGEVVIRSSGELIAPWVEVRACVGETAKCQLAVVNKETKEVARFGDRWSSRFAATGNGSEMRRVDSAPKNAVRTTR